MDASAVAKSTIPVLSVTLSKARRMAGIKGIVPRSGKREDRNKKT